MRRKSKPWLYQRHQNPESYLPFEGTLFLILYKRLRHTMLVSLRENPFFNPPREQFVFHRVIWLLMKQDIYCKIRVILVSSIGTVSNDNKQYFAPSKIPPIEDLTDMAKWKPRNASPCYIPGISLMSDACGRIPRWLIIQRSTTVLPFDSKSEPCIKHYVINDALFNRK